MPRLFVAAKPSASVAETLAALPRPATPGVRWTTPEQWHVTLRFLGDADPDAVMALLDELHATRAEATLGPRVGRLGRSVVVVPVAGLDELVAEVRSVTEELGERPDPRPYLGHLTLARLRGVGSCGLTGAPVDVSFDVAEIWLVESETHPDGARYTDVGRFPLVAR